MAILMVFHYIICVLLIILILLQVGKGANIGAVFGGGGSQSVFGGRGPTTFLNKATAIIAMLFLVTSIIMAHISRQKSSESVLDKVSTAQQKTDAEVDKPKKEAEKKSDKDTKDNK